MTIKLRIDLNPRHGHVTVFTGKDRDHLQHSGSLVLDLEDVEQFVDLFGHDLLDAAREGVIETTVPTRTGPIQTILELREGF